LKRLCKASSKPSLLTIAGAAFVVFVGVTSATPIVAQNTVWRIDSEHSTARLFLASSRIPDARVNIGVARISGLIDRNDGDSKHSDFDFTIYPADETVAPTLSNDKKSYQDLPIAAASTVITFKSQQVVTTDGGAVRVSGELTVTYIERSAAYGPTEAHDGRCTVPQ
jgi:polyisoprenoid-binding protein YceI